MEGVSESASRPVLQFSAGGLVVDPEGRVLMIRARDLRERPVWTLPKGTLAPGEDASARAFVEALRRKDPVAAARFQALREARERSVTELRAAETRYAAGGPELRAAFLAKLRGARRAYAETSLAILDFLDDRDTTTLTEYQAAIAELRALLEQRKQTRAELEKLLGDD